MKPWQIRLAVFTYCVITGALFWRGGDLGHQHDPTAWVYMAGAVGLAAAAAVFEPMRQAKWKDRE